MKAKNEIFSVEKAEDSTGFLLWQVTTLWHREIKKALEEYDLSHAQFVLLASLLWLSQKNEVVTQIHLSSHSKIDPMTTSTVIRALHERGLLNRKTHPTDKRAWIITLTPSGKKVAISAVKTVEKFDDDFFRSLQNQVHSFNTQLTSLLIIGKEV